MRRQPRQSIGGERPSARHVIDGADNRVPFRQSNAAQQAAAVSTDRRRPRAARPTRARSHSCVAFQLHMTCWRRIRASYQEVERRGTLARSTVIYDSASLDLVHYLW